MAGRHDEPEGTASTVVLRNHVVCHAELSEAALIVVEVLGIHRPEREANHARPIGFGQRDGVRVALVPPLEVGGLPLAGRQLQAQDVEVVVEVAIEIEAPDLHDPQPRDSVRHLVPLPAWHRPARPLFTRLACPAERPPSYHPSDADSVAVAGRYDFFMPGISLPEA